MERTYINEAQKAIGGTVKVQGFIENLRNSKYMAFIVLKDITGKLQITVEKEDHPDLVDTIDQLTPDSVITVTGKVVENDYVKMGGVEMIPESIEIESIANALPIVRKEIAATKKKKAVERSSIDQRIDYRWIDLRTDENQLMFKAQSCFVNAMRKFLLDRNFIEIHTPKLIAAASESGSEVFKVDYFDRNAYLAQSPQFYKQMAMAAGFERIFETGPVFRAEKSYTNKHSTEFSGFDLEFSYITSYKDVMKMEEELLTAGLRQAEGGSHGVALGLLGNGLQEGIAKVAAKGAHPQGRAGGGGDGDVQGLGNGQREALGAAAHGLLVGHGGGDRQIARRLVADRGQRGFDGFARHIQAGGWGGEAQPGGAVAALKLLQVHPLVVADGDEIVILLFGVPDEDVLGVVLRIRHVHGGALLHIEYRRVLGDLKGHAPGPEIVIGFLFGHGFCSFACMRPSSARQPPSTSRQVVSKSPVYHGSATLPGRLVKSSRRWIFPSGSPPQMRRMFHRFS